MSLSNFKRKYKAFTSVVGTISILLAVFLGIIELYKLAFVKEYDVEAIGSFKFYEINDSLYNDFSVIIPKLDSIAAAEHDYLKRNMKIRNETLTFVDRLLNKMNVYDYNIPDNVGDEIALIQEELNPKNDSGLQSKFDFEINSNKLKEAILRLKNDMYYPVYLLKLKIKNNSTKELNNVFLKINSTKGFYRIKEEEYVKGEEGYTDQISDFLENIEIGKIEAKDTKHIIVWVKKQLIHEQIRLTHSGSIVDIDFEEFEI